MRYTISWYPFAEDQLAEIWFAAQVRQAVADASDQIERTLEGDAEAIGESRDERTRMVIVPPLVAIFPFDPVAKTVTVLGLRYMRPRR